MTCILCGSNDNAVFLSNKRENFQIVKCNICGLVYIYPPPSIDRIKKIYDKSYYDGMGLEKNEEMVRKIKILTFNRMFDELEKYISVGKILDVGCAAGFSLEAALARNWKPYGVELSEYSSNIAKKKFSETVFTGTLEEASFQNNTFDAIIMSDLLEHVSNPNEILKESKRILKSNGLLCITTPNIESLSSKVLKRNWPNLKFEHLFYFSPLTINIILEKNGFRILQIIHAKKALTPLYFQTIFNVYRNFLITPIVNGLMWISPKSLTRHPFFITAGDMLVIAIKGE